LAIVWKLFIFVEISIPFFAKSASINMIFFAAAFFFYLDALLSILHSEFLISLVVGISLQDFDI
jgi:hypothetical protein